MINFNQIFPLLHCRCVLCDLDGTLVETDEANFLAYQEAIYEVVNVEIEANGERFTKENINCQHGSKRKAVHTHRFVWEILDYSTSRESSCSGVSAMAAAPADTMSSTLP